MTTTQHPYSQAQQNPEATGFLPRHTMKARVFRELFDRAPHLTLESVANWARVSTDAVLNWQRSQVPSTIAPHLLKFAVDPSYVLPAYVTEYCRWVRQAARHRVAAATARPAAARPAAATRTAAPAAAPSKAKKARKARAPAKRKAVAVARTAAASPAAPVAHAHTLADCLLDLAGRVARDISIRARYERTSSYLKRVQHGTVALAVLQRLAKSPAELKRMARQLGLA